MGYRYKEIASQWDRIGGLSSPSKMPCPSSSLPAWDCQSGSKMARKAGTTCSDCYALNGAYTWPTTRAAMDRRLAALASSTWAQDFADVLNCHHDRRAHDVFRWHDSGDIQSYEHLERIAQVARLTPNVRHWLPSKEYTWLRRYVATPPILQKVATPDNLVIRVSAVFVDGKPPQWAKPAGLTTSTVHSELPVIGLECPAPKQGGKCLDCRACWEPAVDNVSYKKH